MDPAQSSGCYDNVVAVRVLGVVAVRKLRMVHRKAHRVICTECQFQSRSPGLSVLGAVAQRWQFASKVTINLPLTRLSDLWFSLSVHWAVCQHFELNYGFRVVCMGLRTPQVV